LLAGLPAWLILSLFPFSHCACLRTIFCSFTQRIDVKGEVITLPHSVNVLLHSKGLLFPNMSKSVILSKGQPLYEIDISRNTTTGNVSAAQIEVINEKIANAEDIIRKLSHNKKRQFIFR
jgi:membrane fusion protein